MQQKLNTISNTTTINCTSRECVDSYKIISDDLLFWVHIIFGIGICALMSLLGIFANLINIIVFIRQGVLSDSSTVSLLGLAVSDIMCLVFLLWFSICLSMVYANPPGLPFHPDSVMILTAGRPKVMFTQITRWITLYISLERCICILFPFKASRLFSPYKTAVIIPCIFIAIFSLLYIPLYANEYLRWEFDIATNMTIMIGHQTAHYRDVGDLLSLVNGIPIPVINIVVVFILTQILAFRVDASRKWRESTATSGTHKSNTGITDVKDTNQSLSTTKSQNKTSSKDRKLVRMIRVICTIFLICFVPEMFIMFAENLVPEIRPGGRYSNLFFVLYSFTFILEAFNSSINVIVYYTMSSRYRKEFDILFGREAPNKK